MKNSAFGEDDVMDYQQEYLVVLISATILWYNGRWIVEIGYKTNNLLRLVYCFGLFECFYIQEHRLSNGCYILVL